MPAMPSNIGAVILAGGQGRRLGHQNKPLVRVGKKRLIGLVLDRLKPQATAIAINANDNADIYAALGYDVIPDSKPGYKGPLAGIQAGMTWARDDGLEYIITIAGDTPLFPTDLVEQLVKQQQQTNADIVLATSCGRTHPVFGLWRADLYEKLGQFLDGDNYKVLGFTDLYKTEYCAFADIDSQTSLDPFFNVNTPDDITTLKFALQKLKQTPQAVIVTGWKNSGKTTLVTKLISYFKSKGIRVGSVKHAHHHFDIDTSGTDSFKHRSAGASETILVSSKRLAHMAEFDDAQSEPDIADILERFSDVDLVIIEGYKNANLPKIVCENSDEDSKPSLTQSLSEIICVASAEPQNPHFKGMWCDRDDIDAIAKCIESHLGMFNDGDGYEH